MNFTTFYFLLCIIFAGRGDERWKKRTRESSYIVGALDESTGMDRDLWPYEDNIDVDADNEFYGNVNYELSKRKNHRKILYSRKREETKKKSISNIFLSNSLYIGNNRSNISKDKSADLKYLKSVKNTNVHNSKNKWPKFEDLLLSVGVDYDFKSDRWIKLKEKLKKNPDESVKHFNNEPYHQKHEFKYRTIRINGSKKRKNIIIALTAIR